MRKFPIISMSILLIFVLLFLPVHGQAIGTLGGSGPGLATCWNTICDYTATPVYHDATTLDAIFLGQNFQTSEVSNLNNYIVDGTILANSSPSLCLEGVQLKYYYVTNLIGPGPENNLRIEESSVNTYPLKLPTLSSAPNKIC